MLVAPPRFVGNNENPLWNDNLVQFARLICALNETHPIYDSILQESMGVSFDELEELFKRAREVLEIVKSNVDGDLSATP